jgi:hypothetical protein
LSGFVQNEYSHKSLATKEIEKQNADETGNLAAIKEDDKLSGHNSSQGEEVELEEESEEADNDEGKMIVYFEKQ